MPTPSKEAQEAESANRGLVSQEARARGGVQATAQELASAGEVFDDPARGELPEARPQQEAEQRSEERVAIVDPRAAKRAEITARFRSGRNEEADGEDFSRSGTPEGFDHPVPDLATAPEAEEVTEQVPAQEEERAEEQPAKRVVKVRGKEIELTDDELIAHAQKSLASDSYLDDAKQRLNQADEFFRDLQNRARHLGQPGEHHARQEEVQPGQQQPQATEEPQHPEEDLIGKAIELIQYGDPDEARQLLDSALESKATKAAETVVQNTLQNEKFRDEGARTAKVLKDFEDQHPDLAKDPRSRAAIEATVFELQKKDLEALGVDPNKLPTRTGQVTPADIATAHRWYRTQGHQVSTPADLLQRATEDFLAWRGNPTGTADQKADPNSLPKAEPRIEVRVDRTQRRQAIPQQPSRSAAPQRTVTPQTTQPRDRSSIVEGMKARNAKLRGSSLGA